MNGFSFQKGTVGGPAAPSRTAWPAPCNVTWSDGTFKGILKSGTGNVALIKVGTGELFLDRTDRCTPTPAASTSRRDPKGQRQQVVGRHRQSGRHHRQHAATLLAAGSVTFTNNIVLPTNASVGTLTIGSIGAVTPTFSGSITGANNLSISSAAQLTLSGANAYTGATTLLAGTLQANHATALGNGGDIVFSGGTLQYGPAAVGQDWGTRVKSNASAVKLDTNGLNAVISGIDGTNTNGLTKTGAGTLTLGASAYSGATAVNAGRLDLAGAIGFERDRRRHGWARRRRLDQRLDRIRQRKLAVLRPRFVRLPQHDEHDRRFGGHRDAQSHVLFAGYQRRGPLCRRRHHLGRNFQFTGRGTAALSGDSKQLLFSYTPASLTWKGNDPTNPTFWDLNTTANWDNAGSADKFFNADTVTFDDTAAVSGYTVAVQGASVSPGNMTFNNSANAYTVSGAIAGSGSLVKNGTNSVALSGPLTYTGGTTVNAGTLTVTGASTTTGGFTVDGGTVTLSARVGSGADGWRRHGHGFRSDLQHRRRGGQRRNAHALGRKQLHRRNRVERRHAERQPRLGPRSHRQRADDQRRHDRQRVGRGHHHQQLPADNQRQLHLHRHAKPEPGNRRHLAGHGGRNQPHKSRLPSPAR